jgi:adenylate kinase family enzyme
VVAEESWIVDSDGYSAVRDVLWARADTLVWMDLPRRQVMWRVVRRSLWRGVRRAELWNGNRETLRAWGHSGHPVRWAWSEYGNRRRTIGDRLQTGTWDHLRVIHLTSAAEAKRWLAGL